MLNPATSPNVLTWVLDLVDIILVMSVNPGFGGQSFLPSQLPKIALLRRMIDAAGHSIALAVDGGITADHAHRRPSQRGADTLIAGTVGLSAADYARAIADLRWPAGHAHACTSREAPRDHREPRRWLRGARRAMARLPNLRMGRVPDAPPCRSATPGPAIPAAARA